MRVAKLIDTVKLRKRIIDGQLRQLHTRTEGKLLYVAVPDPERHNILELELHPAMEIKTNGTEVRGRGVAAILETDVEVYRRSKPTAKCFDEVGGAHFQRRRNQFVASGIKARKVVVIS